MERITELKAQAYDKIAEIDNYNLAINQVREELQKINQQIKKEYENAEMSKAKAKS